MQGPFLRKYGVECTVDFQLWDTDGASFQVAAVHAAGDTVRMLDEGAEGNTTNAFTDEGTGYSIVFTAAEMTCARFVMYVADQTVPKIWLDESVVVETYGNAAAQHAFDLDTATQNVNVSTISNDAVTAAAIANAAIDAATFAAGAIDATAIANGAIDAATFAAGAIDAAAIANAAIDAATFAANAIDANALATDAADEIADHVWDEAIAGHLGGGSTGAALNAISAAGIADAVWDELLAGHTLAGSAGEAQSLGGVSDAVWSYVIEPGASTTSRTAEQIMRLLVAVMCGVYGSTGDWSALSIDGAKVRVSGTLDASGRRISIDVLDGS